MAVKRYWAKSDNTITNAFEENLTTRATGSNMGASDILEVFSIYAQASTTSAEKSRSLIKFNATASTNSISADRTAGTIPASGSVSFYLRLFNAPHSQTLPKNFTMDVSAIDGDWTEGTGLDMDAYKDKGASNWVNAQGTLAKATLANALNISTIAAGDKFTMTVPTSAGGDGVTYTFLFDTATNVEANEDATTFGISTTGIDDDADGAAVLVAAINGTASGKYKYGASDLGAAELAAGTIGLTAAIGGTSTKVTLTMDDNGQAGNVANVLSATTGFEEGSLLLVTAFTGGSGPWSNEGGDYYFDASSSFSASFDSGVEDIEVDISPLVEQWVNSAGNILGHKSDDGIGVYLSNTYEDAERSYYTKKFFGRGTEFFYKRPCIEARWESAKKDDRGNCYYSSSLATGDENLNTIYLYNYFRGQLRNIPEVGTQPVYVSIFSGSSDDKTPNGTYPVSLVVDGQHVTHADRSTVITASYVSTGIYSASFALTAASAPIKTLYDVWFSGGVAVTDAQGASIHYHTGTIKPKTFDAPATAPSEEYVSSITNLKNIYRSDETARFRIYSRQKDWSPTIYTKATAQAEVSIVESGSYEIYRIVDDLKVVPHGTGSTLHTQMSFDVSGSYFDLDMEMLEPGYMYGITLAYYNNSVGSWVEQPETFKFRVESRQN
jgi:hypothetical protein